MKKIIPIFLALIIETQASTLVTQLKNSSGTGLANVTIQMIPLSTTVISNNVIYLDSTKSSVTDGNGVCNITVFGGNTYRWDAGQYGWTNIFMPLDTNTYYIGSVALSGYGPLLVMGLNFTNTYQSKDTFAGAAGLQFTSASSKYTTVNGSYGGSSDGTVRTFFAKGGILTNLFVYWSNLGVGTNSGFCIVTNGVATHMWVTVAGVGSALSSSNLTSYVYIPSNSTISCVATGNNASAFAYNINWSFEKIDVTQ